MCFYQLIYYFNIESLKKNLTSFLRCLSLSRKTKISLSAGILKGLPWETSSSTTEFFFKSRGNTSFLFFYFSHLSTDLVLGNVHERWTKHRKLIK